MKHKYAILTLLGLAVAVAGLALLRLAPASTETPLPYVMLGMGTGVFGWGAGELLKRRAVEGDPAVEKRLRIEQQDERNRTIADRAKARAYDASLYIFSALMLCFTLMRVDLAVILLLVGAYLLVVGINIYYHVKYNREL